MEEIQTATEVSDTVIAPYGAVGLLALRGHRAEAGYLIEQTRAELTRRGEGVGLSMLDWAEAVLYIGLGRYEDARAAALRASEHPHALAASNWGMVELIEAAARAGTPDLADDALRRLVTTTAATGTDWALGVAARSRALLLDGQDAEDLFPEATDKLARSRMALDLARAHLPHGEWLRRQRRRLDARKQPHLAHDHFSDFGMKLFAEARASRAAGDGRARPQTDRGQARRTHTTGVADLPPRGARRHQPRDRRSALHQPRELQYHLRKAYRKLGVKSRTQLARRLLVTLGSRD